MSIERTKSKQKVKEPKTKITWKEIKRQKVLLFWSAIMVAYGVVSITSHLQAGLWRFKTINRDLVSFIRNL